MSCYYFCIKLFLLLNKKIYIKMQSTKTCNARKTPKSATEYSRKEVDELAKTRLGLKSSEIRKLSKKELCRKLEIEWQQKAPPKKLEPKSLDEVCTDRACSRAYPNRLSKAELIERVHAKFPKYSTTALKLMPIKKLCMLLKKPVLKCPTKAKANQQQQSAIPTNGQIGAFHQKQLQKFKKDSTIRRRPRQQQLACIGNSAIPLRKHQKKVIRYFENHRGLIAYHTVGTGKTLTAITISQCFLEKHPDYKVYVVTPASLIQNFKKQMLDYKNIQHPDNYRFFSIQKFVSVYRKNQISCDKILLIVDEAHNLKTLYRKTEPKLPGKKSVEVGVNSRFVEKCAQKASKVLLLTGTPITNSTKDIIALYNMVRDENEPRLDTKRKNLGVNQQTYSTAKLLEKLKCKISVFDERSAEYYPLVKEHEVFLKMTPSYEEKYDKLVSENGLSNLAIKMFGEIDITRFYNGFRRAVNTLEDKDSPKIQWVLDKLKQNRKTIVFSHFLEAGNKAIIKNLPNNIRYAYINGSLPQKDRTRIVNEYNSNKIQVLFISKAGGEGLDLKGTQDIIILEPAWNLSVEEQVIGRGVRYKSHSQLPLSERKVDVYRLYLIKSTDTVVETQTQQEKQKTGSTSIDLLMRHLIRRKEATLDLFRKQLKEISVEESFCE
jgi:SNF2 family DNA or RNA helicase